MWKEPEREVADLFFALGDGTRLAMLGKLAAGRGALSATALSDGAEVTRQAIVKHLQVLERAGLLTHERRGREVLYALERRRLDDARAFLDAISAGWDRAIDRLRSLVEEPPEAARQASRESTRRTARPPVEKSARRPRRPSR